MAVFVYPEKEWRELGDRRWEVEWYVVKASAKARVEAAEARGELDEYDPDVDIVCHTKVFPARSKGLALAYARRMAQCERSAYGSALVTEQVVDWYVEEDRIAEWANVGEPIDV